MDQMNLYQQQKTTEDQILENYIYLRDVILGTRKLYVTRYVSKELENKKCKLCGVAFKPRSPGARYCGDRRIRQGCAYIMAVKAGEKAGKITQVRNKYKTLKKLWEQEN